MEYPSISEYKEAVQYAGDYENAFPVLLMQFIVSIIY